MVSRQRGRLHSSFKVMIATESGSLVSTDMMAECSRVLSPSAKKFRWSAGSGTLQRYLGRCFRAIANVRELKRHELRAHPAICQTLTAQSADARLNDRTDGHRRDWLTGRSCDYPARVLERESLAI